MNKKYTAQDFGYKGHEMLMNPFTGSIDTADVWASDAHDWIEAGDIFEQFSSLVEVE